MATIRCMIVSPSRYHHQLQLHLHTNPRLNSLDTSTNQHHTPFSVPHSTLHQNEEHHVGFCGLYLGCPCPGSYPYRVDRVSRRPEHPRGCARRRPRTCRGCQRTQGHHHPCAYQRRFRGSPRTGRKRGERRHQGTECRGNCGTPFVPRP
jgi:hypothetical protein